MSAEQDVKNVMLQELSPRQIISVSGAKSRVNLWHGSIRSGKTIASLLAWLLFVAQAPRGGELVMVGRTRDSVARNIFGPLTDPTLFGRLAYHSEYTAGAPTARILGRTIHILGASDNRSEMVLRGLTVAGVYVDEATLVSEAFWTQLLGRMSVTGAKLFATTNPDDPHHWLKVQYLDRAEALGYDVFRFRLEDNTHLDPEYVEQIKREYTGLWYRRFVEGEWVQAAGAIYDMWDESKHLISEAKLPKMDLILNAGLDYGDIHKTRGYLLGLGPDTDPKRGGYRLYVLNEWAPGKATVGEHAADFEKWIKDQPDQMWSNPKWVSVDSAAASFRRQLFHDGRTNVRNAHKSVMSGIRTVSALLAVGKLAVVSERCPELVKAIPGYIWDEKATNRGETAPVKKNDDEVDALRYTIHTMREDWRELVPLTPTEENYDTGEGAEDASAQ